MIDPSLDTQDVTEQPLGCFMQGHWYLDPATKLMYIVLMSVMVWQKTHGPDDAILDALDRRYRDADTSSSDWFDLILSSPSPTVLTCGSLHNRFDASIKTRLLQLMRKAGRRERKYFLLSRLLIMTIWYLVTKRSAQPITKNIQGHSSS
jgi:hypothetical protein